MSSRYLIPLAVAAALAAPVAAHAQDEGTYDPGKWLVRVGLSQINPDNENLEIPGAFLVVDSDITPTATVEYMLTPHIGTELLGDTEQMTRVQTLPAGCKPAATP